MSELIKEKDPFVRTHLDSRFMRESLVDRKVLSSSEVIHQCSATCFFY